MVDPNDCKCSLATRAVGDGCQHCNPAKTIELLEEQIAKLRPTEEELSAIDRAAGFLEQTALNGGPRDLATAALVMRVFLARYKEHHNE